MPRRQKTEVGSPARRQLAGKGLAGGTFAKLGPRDGAAPEGQVSAVMAAAQRSGLLEEKSGRIGGRVSPALVERAKARTGIEANTDLIAFALANIALEDKFAESVKAARGTVDADLTLGI